MFLHFKFLTFVLFLTSLKFVIFCYYFFKFLRNVRIFFDTMRLSHPIKDGGNGGRIFYRRDVGKLFANFNVEREKREGHGS